MLCIFNMLRYILCDHVVGGIHILKKDITLCLKLIISSSLVNFIQNFQLFLVISGKDFTYCTQMSRLFKFQSKIRNLISEMNLFKNYFGF